MLSCWCFVSFSYSSSPHYSRHHSHGPCCYFPFTPSFLSFPFKSYRSWKRSKALSAKATSQLCQVKSKPQMVEKASRGRKTSRECADISNHSYGFYLQIFYWQQEKSHFSKCQVRSKNLGRVSTANAEAELLGIGEGHMCGFCLMSVHLNPSSSPDTR